MQLAQPPRHVTGWNSTAVHSAQDSCGHSSGPDSSMCILWTLLEISRPLRGRGKKPTMPTACLQRARAHLAPSAIGVWVSTDSSASWGFIPLEHKSTAEWSAMIETFYTCSVRYGRNQPHVAVEHLKSDSWTWGTEILTLLSMALNLNGYIWLVAPVLDSVVLEGGRSLKGSIPFSNDPERDGYRNSQSDLSHPLPWNMSESR